MKKGIWAVVIFLLILSNLYLYFEIAPTYEGQSEDVSEPDFFELNENFFLFIIGVSLVLIIAIVFWILKSGP
ncbi:MAG: hypothetical protein WDZ69_03180 [Candidatus Pacearchaeota archaeon]